MIDLFDDFDLMDHSNRCQRSEKMPTGQEIVDLELKQDGKPYIYGYEVDLDDPDPEAFDCSEMEEWACWQLKVKPRFPDGSANQLDFCRKHDTLISIEEAISTPGALLFYQTSTHHHVATSQGNGKTIEARGKDYGVGQWTAYDRGWTHAALIPGVTYEV
jgi:cell wall-associated NlpC family hydrolase